MQLIIDVGNTRVKLAVFEGNSLEFRVEEDQVNFLSSLERVIQDFPIKRAIISSVGNLEEKYLRAVQNRFPTVTLDQFTPVPFKNDYGTPGTLGVDRIALVSAFAKAYPGRNGLIIDAGTCITYDFLNDQGEYKGGAISPGIRLRYKALHTLTANLPLLDTKDPNAVIGNSTENAIHSGVVNGTSQEIDGVINQYKEEYTDLVIILTGGDAQILSKRLKSSIFAHSNFLLEGLNYILRFTND